MSRVKECSDLLFRANEYLEAYLMKDGRSENHFLDTKKDLANNAEGRRIAIDARSRSLTGNEGERYLLAHVLTAIDSGNVINHYLDPRVELLPNPDQYGCQALPERPTKH